MFETQDGTVFEREIEARWYEFFQATNSIIEATEYQDTFVFKMITNNFTYFVTVENNSNVEQDYEFLQENEIVVLYLPNELNTRGKIFISDPKIVAQMDGSDKFIITDIALRECECQVKPTHLMTETLLEDEEYEDSTWIKQQLNKVKKIKIKELVY